MNRVNIGGKGQALDGDVTTTGAICIADNPNHRCDASRCCAEVMPPPSARFAASAAR